MGHNFIHYGLLFATSYPFKKSNMNITMVVVVVVRDLGPYFKKLFTNVERVASTHSNRALFSSADHDCSSTSTWAC